MREDAGDLIVCVDVYGLSVTCPVAYSFSVILVSLPGSACEYSVTASLHNYIERSHVSRLYAI